MKISVGRRVEDESEPADPPKKPKRALDELDPTDLAFEA